MSDVLRLHFWFGRWRYHTRLPIPPSPSACSVTQTQLYQCLLSQHLFFALWLLLCKSYLCWADLCITIIFPFLYNLISHLLSFPYHYHYLFLHSPTELKAPEQDFLCGQTHQVKSVYWELFSPGCHALMTLSLGCMGWCSLGQLFLSWDFLPPLLWWILFSWLCILFFLGLYLHLSGSYSLAAS